MTLRTITTLSISWKIIILLNICLKGGRGTKGFTIEEKSLTNYSSTFLNADELSPNIEGNACGSISALVVEITFDNYYIHILHYMQNKYMFRYLVSKLISSNTAMQSVMRQTMHVLMVWFPGGKISCLMFLKTVLLSTLQTNWALVWHWSDRGENIYHQCISNIYFPKDSNQSTMTLYTNPRLHSPSNFLLQKRGVYTT